MVKVRQGFVSNSSSSSFVILSLGQEIILEDGDTCVETCGSVDINIDELINQLQKAKKNGETVLNITHGGGYEG